MTDTVGEFLAGTFIGVMGWFFGGFDGFVKVLLAFSVVDYISGVMAAWMQGRIDSQVGFKGILKKCVMFSLVGVANLIDMTFLNNSNAVRAVVVLFYVGNEGMSIMENAHRLGVPFPKVLRDKFEQFREEDDIENTAQRGGERDGSSETGIIDELQHEAGGREQE